MGEILTGHYDALDAITRNKQIFAQFESDLDFYEKTGKTTPLLAMYSEMEDEKTSRIIRQAPKEFKEDGEASSPEAQRGRKVEMTFLSKSYSVRTEMTKDFLEDANAKEIIDEHGQALIADDKLLNRLFFIALMLRPTTSTTSDKLGFYYGQKDVPNYQGIVHYNVAHNHYPVTAAAGAWAAADLETGRDNITHHGYGETNGGVSFLANTATMVEFAGLDGFTDESITEEQQRNGIVAKMKGVLLHEINWVPANYGIFIPTAALPLMVFKQHFKKENHGLKIMPGGNPADPLEGSAYKRIKIGMNVVLKGAGVVMYKGATWTQQTTLTTS